VYFYAYDESAVRQLDVSALAYTPCPQKVSQMFFAITLKIVHKFPANLTRSCSNQRRMVCVPLHLACIRTYLV